MYKKILMFLMGFSMCCLVVGSVGWSADFENLSAQALKARMESGTPILVLNPLSDIEFAEGHIPRSVNIPLHLIASTSLLPVDKTTPIVTYCLGPK
jgi:rhodanese-related sulfurtransferase